MICPLMSYKRISKFDGAPATVNCYEEECAWYNRNKEECCIKILSENIEEVAEGQRTIFTREV